jgi:hypothetical protein
MFKVLIASAGPLKLRDSLSETVLLQALGRLSELFVKDDRHLARLTAGIESSFYTVPIGQAADLLEVFGAGFEHVIRKTEPLRNLQTFVHGINSKQLVSACCSSV